MRLANQECRPFPSQQIKVFALEPYLWLPSSRVNGVKNASKCAVDVHTFGVLKANSFLFYIVRLMRK